MEFEVNDLSHFPLSNDECVVVLSNLLDNAIEACSVCAGEKLIRIRMKKDKEYSKNPGARATTHGTRILFLMKCSCNMKECCPLFLC